ncbi:unnamed protein product [Closterium sp. Naga37s-1]|nr:unnamed protein product [Closterium sp. Naga37s-1]
MDLQFRYTAEEKMQKIYIANDMLREECGRVQGAYSQVVSQNQELKSALAQRDVAYAQLLAEFEALKCSGGAPSHGVNASAGRGGSSTVSDGGAVGQSSATPQAVSVEEAFFKHAVVEWRDAKTVAAAWGLWVKKAHIMNGQSLREVRVALEKQHKNFFSTYATYAPGGPSAMATETCDRKMRRWATVMEAVESFRVDITDAETAYAVARLDTVLAKSNFRDFTDGLILGAALPKKRSRKTTTVGKSTNEKAHRYITWLIVKMELRDEAWAAKLFGAEWNTIKIAEEEKEAAAAARAASAAQPASPNAT